MSNKQHTPGPWLIQGKTVYALMHHGWRKGVEQLKNRFYASVYVDRECDEKEAEANVRLIAAAPDLLEALKIASDWMVKVGPNAETGTPDWHQHCEDLIRIGDAIEKATGEAK